MNVLTLLLANSAILVIILLVLLLTAKKEHPNHDSKEDLQKIKDQINE